jgi:hypothetical protein
MYQEELASTRNSLENARFTDIHSAYGTTARRGRPGPSRPPRAADGHLHCSWARLYGTSVPEIAERADIAAGTIYHYFDSKEALVNALTARGDQGRQRVSPRSHPAPVREQFRVMWQADHFATWPAAFAFIRTQPPVDL